MGFAKQIQSYSTVKSADVGTNFEAELGQIEVAIAEANLDSILNRLAIKKQDYLRKSLVHCDLQISVIAKRLW